MQTDVIILGAGTAGLSAAIYATRAGLSVTVLEHAIQGGQIINAPEVDNYPGLANISGVEFVQNIYQQAVDFGASVVYESIKAFDFSRALKQVDTDKNRYEAKAVIIANGARHRHLDVPGEVEFAGKGVSYCATCDGAFYRGKDVCIVGGGNTALEDALFLSNNCNKVYLIHRRDEFRAHATTVEAVSKRDNIEILTPYTVSRIEGEASVNRVVLSGAVDGAEKTIEVAGVFIAVGLSPDNGMFSPALELDRDGYFVAGEDCRTNIEGVYAAGDTRRKEVRQLVTAAADGAVAAIGAANYINQNRSKW